MKLIDLNQTIFVPVVDETKGGMMVEMKMTVGEFFRKFCQGFEPKTVEAIPVEWMREKMRGYASSLKSTETAALVMVMQMWQKEQEAR